LFVVVVGAMMMGAEIVKQSSILQEYAFFDFLTFFFLLFP